MKYFLLLILIFCSFIGFAQHEHHMPSPAAREDHQHHADTMASPPMSHAFSLNAPMNRNGSGTGWLPDASPMYGYMHHGKQWMYMFHGNVFARYNRQVGKSRGDSEFDAPNWLMAMGQRKVGEKGLFRFSTMFSLDELTGGAAGYPLLFQSGEAYKGSPLVDRQHPHDLFSELSVAYTHSLNANADLFLYAAYPGEPALGPTAFMHRPSAMYNPDAPLSHHWIDATHITFGVVTGGIRFHQFKLEASSFTGREPDEKRYDFDKPRFDSYSARLSYNPSGNWALQVSQAFVNQPELMHPGKDINRTTASALYSRELGDGDRELNAAAIWGMNKAKHHDAEHAAVLEASLRMKRLTLSSRFEYVEKSAEELVLDENQFDHDALFPVKALTVGMHYDLFELKHTRLAAGAQFTGYAADKALDALYGSQPHAFQFWLRLYPGKMKSN